MSLPSASLVAVCPAIHTMRPPSVTTSGENTRLLGGSLGDASGAHDQSDGETRHDLPHRGALLWAVRGLTSTAHRPRRQHRTSAGRATAIGGSSTRPASALH